MDAPETSRRESRESYCLFETRAAACFDGVVGVYRLLVVKQRSDVRWVLQVPMFLLPVSPFPSPQSIPYVCLRFRVCVYAFPFSHCTQRSVGVSLIQFYDVHKYARVRCCCCRMHLKGAVSKYGGRTTPFMSMRGVTHVIAENLSAVKTDKAMKVRITPTQGSTWTLKNTPPPSRTSSCADSTYLANTACVMLRIDRHVVLKPREGRQNRARRDSLPLTLSGIYCITYENLI